jgi:hypothetical protein
VFSLPFLSELLLFFLSKFSTFIFEMAPNRLKQSTIDFRKRKSSALPEDNNILKRTSPRFNAVTKDLVVVRNTEATGKAPSSTSPETALPTRTGSLAANLILANHDGVGKRQLVECSSGDYLSFNLEGIEAVLRVSYIHVPRNNGDAQVTGVLLLDKEALDHFYGAPAIAKTLAASVGNRCMDKPLQECEVVLCKTILTVGEESLFRKVGVMISKPKDLETVVQQYGDDTQLFCTRQFKDVLLVEVGATTKFVQCPLPTVGGVDAVSDSGPLQMLSCQVCSLRNRY